jgi:hypothetical protein
MTYGTPELLLVGSAKTLVRGASNFGAYTSDNVVVCGPQVSRDSWAC